MIYCKNLRVFATASAFALAFHVGFSSDLCAMDDAEGGAGLRTPRKSAKAHKAELFLSPVPKKDSIENHPVFTAQRSTIADLRVEADDLHSLSETLAAELEQTTAKALALREQRQKLAAKKEQLEKLLKANAEQLANNEMQMKRTHEDTEALRASLATSQTEKQQAISKHEDFVRALTEARAAKLAKQKEEDGKTNAVALALAERLEKERAERAEQHSKRMQALMLRRSSLPSSPATNGTAASSDI